MPWRSDFDKKGTERARKNAGIAFIHGDSAGGWKVIEQILRLGEMWANKSWTIWHPISTMWKRVWSTWSHKICILVSVKHFSPTNVCVMTFTETDLSETSNSSRSWTQEVVNMAAPCWKLLWSWYVSGFNSWKIRNEQKRTWKVLGTSSLPQFEKTSLKSEKKYKNHRQAEYYHTLKKEEKLCQVPCPGLEPGTSRLRSECATNWAILPNEKLRKNNDNIYLICCSTSVC